LDDTRDIALKYCKAFPKIRYSRHAENLGASKNWLHVFSLARGEYFMWAAHDDLWDVNFVSEIMNGMLSDPDFTTGFCQLDEFWHEPTNKLKTKFREPPPFSPMASRSENQVMYFAQPCPWMIYGIHKTAAMRSIVDSEPDLDATSYFF
jgi:glycosyltransferase involved in cell wall biosynthesis